MDSMQIHNIKSMTVTTQKLRHDNGKPFFTKTLEVISQTGLKMDITFFDDNEENLKIKVEK